MYYCPRIDGRSAYPYTWRDLLPYKKTPLIISGKIIDIDSTYIVFTIENQKYDYLSGKLYRKYFKKTNMIILDRALFDSPYSEPLNPNLFEKCGKAKFWELLYVM